MRAPLLLLPLLFSARLATAGEVPPASTEPPEPPPAPLQVAPEPSPEKPAPPPIEMPARRRDVEPSPASPHTYRIAAWTGVGVTLAFLTSGIVLGILAQHDSDDLQVLLGERAFGKPPLYDADHQARYTNLTSNGAAYNRATIACFIVAGVSAVTSGLLFWDATRRAAEKRTQARFNLRPGLALANGESHLVLSGIF